MDDFKKEAESSFGQSGSEKMIAFGGEKEESSFEGDFEDDFEDDFKDDFKGDFEEDFEEDFEDSSTAEDSARSEKPVEEPVAKSHSISSVMIETKSVDSKFTGIEDEIIRFLEYHRVDVSGCTEENLYQYWNRVYNVRLFSNEDCFAEYLRIVYGLWFNDTATMSECIKYAVYPVMKMQRRLCTLQDVHMFMKCSVEPWFKPDVINKYSNEDIFNQPLCDLMEQGKVQEEILDEFVGDSVALMCCIRLLLADAFNLLQFRNAVVSGNVTDYTNDLLNSNIDRFACIRHREDFPQLFEIITNSENCGKAIRQEVIEEYADAVYLDVILRAEAQSRLDKGFADAYLVKDLGNCDFLAEVYDKNAIDISLDREHFARAKVLTDARSLDLTLENFKPEYNRAMMCLLLSKFKGDLTLVDYKKFLALCSFTAGETVLQQLNQQQNRISSYNQFWFSFLLQEFGLEQSVTVDQDIEDNILFIQQNGNKYLKFYLQLDDFVLNPAAFKALIKDTQFVELIPNGLGLILSTVNVPKAAVYSIRFSSKGSLTTWAEDKLNNAVMQQFKQYNAIAHANFLYAMSLANRQLKQENGAEASLSSSVLDFLKMDLSLYYRYDKMFAFLAESKTFLGLFSVHLGSKALTLFSAAYVYENDAKRIFIFLYRFFREFFFDKLKLYTAGFSELNGNKDILFVKGLHPTINCLNFKTVIDSLDNFYKVSEKSKEIKLFIDEETINIEF